MVFLGSLTIKQKKDIIQTRGKIKNLCQKLEIKHLDTIKLLTAINEISRFLFKIFHFLEINFSLKNINRKIGLNISFVSSTKDPNENINLNEMEINESNIARVQNLVDVFKQKQIKNKLKIEILHYLSFNKLDFKQKIAEIQNIFSRISEESAYEALKSQNEEIISLYQQIKGKNKELKGLNDQLKEKNEKLEKVLVELDYSNKRIRKTLDQFAYAASHDFKEPLRMVINFTQLLELKYKNELDEKARTYIKYAIDGANRMSNLIDELLVFSRIDSSNLKGNKIDLNILIEEVIDALQIFIKKNNGKITYDDLPKLKANRSQIFQLFQNLIENSIKFHRDIPPKIHISFIENEDHYTFSIEDNGKGIESKYLDQIFILFNRLDDRSKYKGNGIGLAISKKIVEAHDGKIWVESTPNVGSTFFFTIPKN